MLLRAALETGLAKNKLTLERFTTEVRPIPGEVRAISIDAKAVG